jgi:enoyl-CoA hydratase/carnithine racemase
LGQCDALAADRRRIHGAEALRIGLIQEVVEPGAQLDRAVQLAEQIATRSAPLGVRATLAAAQRAKREGERAADDRFVDDVVVLFKTQDGRKVSSPS